MSRKGLKRRGSTYFGMIEGWEVLCRDVGTHALGACRWSYIVQRRGVIIGTGHCRTLTAARAAARAVVLEREARGLEPLGVQTVLVDGVAVYYWHSDVENWLWCRRGTTEKGTAPTLSEALEAAWEVSE